MSLATVSIYLFPSYASLKALLEYLLEDSMNGIFLELAVPAGIPTPLSNCW